MESSWTTPRACPVKRGTGPSQTNLDSAGTVDQTIWPFARGSTPISAQRRAALLLAAPWLHLI